MLPTAVSPQELTKPEYQGRFVVYVEGSFTFITRISEVTYNVIEKQLVLKGTTWKVGHGGRWHEYNGRDLMTTGMPVMSDEYGILEFHVVGFGNARIYPRDQEPAFAAAIPIAAAS